MVKESKAIAEESLAERGAETMVAGTRMERSVMLHNLLKSKSRLTVGEVRLENPTLGSWDTILVLAKHLERLGLVRLSTKEYIKDRKICLV